MVPDFSILPAQSSLAMVSLMPELSYWYGLFSVLEVPGQNTALNSPWHSLMVHWVLSLPPVLQVQVSPSQILPDLVDL